MHVQATATVSSGTVRVRNVDISPLATFASSTPMFSVSQLGIVSVVQPPTENSSGKASGRISIAEMVTGTAMQVSALTVQVMSSEVTTTHLLQLQNSDLVLRWHLTIASCLLTHGCLRLVCWSQSVCILPISKWVYLCRFVLQRCTLLQLEPLQLQLHRAPTCTAPEHPLRSCVWMRLCHRGSLMSTVLVQL